MSNLASIFSSHARGDGVTEGGRQKAEGGKFRVCWYERGKKNMGSEYYSKEIADALCADLKKAFPEFNYWVEAV